jgi:hypothetical protein
MERGKSANRARDLPMDATDTKASFPVEDMCLRALF